MTNSISTTSSPVPPTLGGLAKISVLCYLGALPFPHNAAFKYIMLVVMLLAFLWGAWAKVLRWDWRSPLLVTVLLVVGLFGISALWGVDPLDSLNEIRKHFLPGLLLLVLIPSFFCSDRELVLLLGVLTASFLVRTVLALGEVYFFQGAELARAEGAYFKGYSMDATLYAPFFLGAWLWASGRVRWLIALGLGLVLLDMLAAQSRTPLAAVFIATVASLVLLKQWRYLLVLAGVTLLTGVAVWVAKPEMADRFASTFSHAEYSGAQGMSGRYPIWMGVTEIAMARPVLGYGFGWKKLGRTAVSGGYVERWQAQVGDPRAQSAAWYFSLPTDKVNPHNLGMQVFFEGGFLGLAVYGLALLSLFWQTIRQTLSVPPVLQPLAVIAVAYLAGHVVLSISDGIWIGAGPTMAALALFEIVRRRKGSEASPDPQPIKIPG